MSPAFLYYSSNYVNKKKTNTGTSKGASRCLALTFQSHIKIVNYQKKN